MGALSSREFVEAPLLLLTLEAELLGEVHHRSALGMEVEVDVVHQRSPGHDSLKLSPPLPLFGNEVKATHAPASSTYRYW